MFTDFYKLKALPFQLTPDHRFFFSSSVHSSAMAHLTYGLSQGEGFIIITGDIGAGKTTLVGHLLSTLDKEQFVAAKVVTTQLDADNMLRMVSSAFGLPIENIDKASLLRRVEAFLRDTVAVGKRCLLVIDEVQNVPVPALEELRMLSNFQIDGRTPMQCFLLGQPQFRRTLASPDLEQLRQRVTATYHLASLGQEETRSYIEHRLKLAGWDGDPKFSNEAFREIFAYTRGTPRLINMLCSRLMLFGYLEELHEIDGEVVLKVAEEHANETRQIAGLEPKAAPGWDGESETAAEPAKTEIPIAEPEPEPEPEPRPVAPRAEPRLEPALGGFGRQRPNVVPLKEVAANRPAEEPDAAPPLIQAEVLSEVREVREDTAEILRRLDGLEQHARSQEKLINKVLHFVVEQIGEILRRLVDLEEQGQREPPAVPAPTVGDATERIESRRDDGRLPPELRAEPRLADEPVLRRRFRRLKSGQPVGAARQRDDD